MISSGDKGGLFGPRQITKIRTQQHRSCHNIMLVVFLYKMVLLNMSHHTVI